MISFGRDNFVHSAELRFFFSKHYGAPHHPNQKSNRTNYQRKDKEEWFISAFSPEVLAEKINTESVNNVMKYDTG